MRPRARDGKRFTAVLERGDRALGWTIARVPFPPEDLGEMIRLRVSGQIAAPSGDPVPFRTSLFPDPRGGFFLLVNRTMQAATGLALGDTAHFVLRADLDPRPAELPDHLAALLDEEPELHAWYGELTENMRREIGNWILAVKSEESRLRRAQQIAERMMLTMEGERVLPPILEQAFRLRPKARAGWATMTALQRRGELMAVFYYQTPESRQKRVEKLCDAAEKRA